MGEHRAAGEMDGGGSGDLDVRCFGENLGGYQAIALRGRGIWGRVWQKDRDERDRGVSRNKG